jgi:hypothetical protein
VFCEKCVKAGEGAIKSLRHFRPGPAEQPGAHFREIQNFFLQGANTANNGDAVSLLPVLGRNRTCTGIQATTGMSAFDPGCVKTHLII